MKTIINRFGEEQTSWRSHKHPDNPDFMQMVSYMHIKNKDGQVTLYWSLCNASANDNHFIPDISLDEAIERFTDEEVKDNRRGRACRGFTTYTSSA